jgi:hypothetical protein
MIETCELMAPPGGCRWCGGPLPVGARIWCSKGCEHGYSINHHWSAARVARLAADEWQCQVCGLTDEDGPLEVHHDPKAPHYGPGCHHHQEKLATLCVPHHRERDRAAAEDRPVQLTLVA